MGNRATNWSSSLTSAAPTRATQRSRFIWRHAAVHAQKVRSGRSRWACRRAGGAARAV